MLSVMAGHTSRPKRHGQWVAPVLPHALDSDLGLAPKFNPLDVEKLTPVGLIPDHFGKVIEFFTTQREAERMLRSTR